jgi:hypothetical protein
VATLVLLPLFVGGMVRTRRTTHRARRPWLLDERWRALRNPASLGWVCLLVGAGGVALAGCEIFRIGTMETFVPEDLQFMGVAAEHLHATNPRLVPLIAHDRAGFGGAVLTACLTAFGCLLFTPVQRALWQAMLVGGTVSLSAAIGVHFTVGYIDLWHLAPAAAGAIALVTGLALAFPAVRMRRPPAG